MAANGLTRSHFPLLKQFNSPSSFHLFIFFSSIYVFFENIISTDELFSFFLFPMSRFFLPPHSFRSISGFEKKKIWKKRYGLFRNQIERQTLAKSTRREKKNEKMATK